MNPLRDPLLRKLTRTTLGSAVVCLLSSTVLADAQRLSLMPDPRGEFIRLCAPFMVSRYAHPETVCNCLRNTIFDEVRDFDVLDALLYGVTERGVPTLNRAWLPRDKWPLIEPTMTAIAEPTLECMFGDGSAKRAVEAIPPDGVPAMPPVQDLTP